MSSFGSTRSNFSRELFSTQFLVPFCTLIYKRNLGLFQASGIIHVLPQIKIRYFQTQIIVDPSTPKPLSFVGELHRFFLYKSVILTFFGFDRNALKKKFI